MFLLWQSEGGACVHSFWTVVRKSGQRVRYFSLWVFFLLWTDDHFFCRVGKPSSPFQLKKNIVLLQCLVLLGGVLPVFFLSLIVLRSVCSIRPPTANARQEIAHHSAHFVSCTSSTHQLGNETQTLHAMILGHRPLAVLALESNGSIAACFAWCVYSKFSRS